MADRKSANRPRVTLKNVADAAGVNIATASRVLAGKAQQYRISKATENAVQEVAAQMRYQPNRMAQSLRTKRSGLIGVVVPDVADHFFSEVAKQVTTVANQQGLSAILADSGNSTDVERELIEQLLARQVDGLIVCPVGVEFEHLHAIRNEDCPFVMADRVSDAPGMVTVTSDNVDGAKALLELLYDAGHVHVGVLKGLSATQPNEERLSAYRELAEARTGKYVPSYVCGTDFSESSGYKSAMELLDRHPEVTALFAMSNPIALGALRAIKELGRRIPDDLSIVSFDDHPLIDYMKTPLTTAGQDVAELGRIASQLLMEQITSGKLPESRNLRIATKIQRRGSIRTLGSG